MTISFIPVCRLDLLAHSEGIASLQTGDMRKGAGAGRGIATMKRVFPLAELCPPPRIDHWGIGTNALATHSPINEHADASRPLRLLRARRGLSGRDASACS